MADLEDGIQTYQSLAEEKQKEAEEERSKVMTLQEENHKLKIDLERMERKLKDSKL